MPDFSILPAPLTLFILLELPSLKALYAAILASPHLNAVFRSNAQRVFRTVIAQSLSDELVSPVLIYMLLRERLVTSGISRTFTIEQLQNMADDLIAAATTDQWPKIAVATIFHTVAQAVRVHDIASFILRSKLDCLGTLRFERLANPRYRYRGPHSLNDPDPQGVPIEIHLPLSDPSWEEETRAIRVLWLLAACWRAMQSTTTSGRDTVERFTAPQRAFFGLEDQMTLDMATEMAQSIIFGPSLRSPDEPNKRLTFSYGILQAYPIKGTVYTTKALVSDLLPTSPNFSWCPAVTFVRLASDTATRGEAYFPFRQ
ncbi:hypothetical protein AUEXF2481DRAFT_35179 [Aureobasidium subglaciale EXF-2481]|uniref:F-box domain-containing protein n=1 Tax=Aureobasidium subglaciale (strain EXF-2481) TaxID=1043005 RepID=A0A074Z3N2_AURSE|nr:uncharacterized protein AUEXF2481DRAFT_35179 [Aureobasidium subglaciale EXF-2481]KER00923.1 hypothetical protein AUEXF2481DRAFT_35179 [Aureobasidium subglaciale EXF-2481]